MMRLWKLRLLPLALVAFVAAGCGDNGTNPGVEDFDADLVSGAAEAVLAPMEASSDAQYAVFDFLLSVLGGGTGFDAPVLASDRAAVAQRIPVGPVHTLLHQSRASAQSDIPAELFGRTYVWDDEAFEWVVDETATGAPSNGVRVIWYLTDDQGYVTPLQPQGHVDLSNAAVGGVDGVRVEIVRTVGGTATLADFTQGYESTETETAWTEEFQLEGVFGDGAEQVDVDAAITGGGSFVTYDDEYLWDLLFDGSEGTYRWQLDGSWDDSESSYDDDYDITITQDSDVTILAMDLTGEGGGNGTGSLSHNGVTIANILANEGEFLFSKPGGGSFTEQEIARLEGLSYLMFIYGPLLILTFLFFLLG